MTTLDPLILDFLEWLAKEPRLYADVMDAWRTSCPRLTVWEDAMDRALIVRVAGDTGPMIALTPDGLSFLAAHRRVAHGVVIGAEADCAPARLQ